MITQVPDSPGPSSRSANMRANGRRDTKPELELRSALHRRGLRFRVDYAVPVDGRSPKADIVFTRPRIAVFVDGCFWHGCAEHSQRPRANSDYWGPKITRNIERDAQQTAQLETAGWRVLRVWEHEPVADAVARVVEAVEARTDSSQAS